MHHHLKNLSLNGVRVVIPISTNIHLFVYQCYHWLNLFFLFFCRKSYVSNIDLDLTLSDYDSLSSPSELVEVEALDNDQTDSGKKPNFEYINTTGEDMMVVQHILSLRMGTREIVSSDGEDELQTKQLVESEIKKEDGEHLVSTESIKEQVENSAMGVTNNRPNEKTMNMTNGILKPLNVDSIKYDSV